MMVRETLERVANELELPNSGDDQSLHDRRIAEELNKRDSLARFRDQFLFPRKKDIQNDENGPEESAVYLCGNSLGLQPKNARFVLFLCCCFGKVVGLMGCGSSDFRVYVLEEMDKWQKVGVEGHFTGARPWLTIDEFVHEKMARVVVRLMSSSHSIYFAEDVKSLGRSCLRSSSNELAHDEHPLAIGFFLSSHSTKIQDYH